MERERIEGCGEGKVGKGKEEEEAEGKGNKRLGGENNKGSGYKVNIRKKGSEWR